MLLLKLRWAAVLLNEFWRCRRAESASCLPTMPGKTGGLGRRREPWKVCLVSLDLTRFDFDDTNFSLLKCSSSLFASTRLVPVWTSVGGWWGGSLLRSRGCHVAPVQAETSSETAPGICSNWTLYFSLLLPSHAELLPSLSRCLRETSCDGWESTGPALCARGWRTVPFRSTAWWCPRETSCRVLLWCTEKGPASRFTVGDGFRRSAEAELLVLCPRLWLIPLVGTEGIKAGEDLSLCREEKAEGLTLLAANIAPLLVERWQGFFIFSSSSAQSDVFPRGSLIFSLKPSIFRGLAGPDPLKNQIQLSLTQRKGSTQQYNCNYYYVHAIK